MAKPTLLLDAHLKALRLPTFLREYDKVARQCAQEGGSGRVESRQSGPWVVVDLLTQFSWIVSLLRNRLHQPHRIGDMGVRVVDKLTGRGYPGCVWEVTRSVNARHSDLGGIK